MKLCKDCKWCKPDFGLSSFFGLGDKYRFAKCDRAQAAIKEICYVTGKNKVIFDRSFCKVERMFDCGIEAKYYELKDSSGLPQEVIRSSLLDCYAGEFGGEPALMRDGEPMCWGEDLWLNNRDKTPTEAAAIFLQRMKRGDIKIMKGTV